MKINAIINGQGTHYADGTERLYLHILKSQDHGLPIKDGKRVPITFVIGSKEYRGTLGSRSNLIYLFLTTSLLDSDGKEHKQTYLLRDNCFSKGQHVQVTVTGNRIILS